MYRPTPAETSPRLRLSILRPWPSLPRRRLFVLRLLALWAVWAPAVPATAAETAKSERPEVDLLIVGGTESGCAAAIQAARMGVKSILLVNDTPWLGGQFSSEALGAIDENRDRGGTNAPPFPRAGLFLEAIERIEARNRRLYGSPRPGRAIVRNTVRPADGAAVFAELVEPYVAAGTLKIRTGLYPTRAMLSNDRKTLQGLHFEPVPQDLSVAGGGTGTATNPLDVAAKLTIDASDWGEAIQVAGAEFEVGPDPKSRYGEPHAFDDPTTYPPTEMNPITWCLIVERTDQDQIVPAPPGYDERRYWRELDLFSADRRKLPWNHGQWGAYGKMESLYKARRLVERPGADVLLLNRPSSNYPLDHLPAHVVAALEATEPGASRKNIVTLSRTQREIVFRDAKAHAVGFLHFLQTAVHDRLAPADRAFGLRKFRLSNEFGTADRLPPKPYIRESLRLKALYMMREQETLNADRTPGKYATVMYDDTVGCWQFEYDYHPTGRAFLMPDDPASVWESRFKPGRGWGVYSDRATLPLRSLIPVRVDGLLGAQKNLGASSQVISALRLHDQSMAVGQAAGATAAVCLKHAASPRTIPTDRALLTAVQVGLCASLDGGKPLPLWPFRDLDPAHPAYVAANLLAARGALPLERLDPDFRPDAPAEPEWRQRVAELTRLSLADLPNPPTPPAGDLSRGDFARRWWELVQDSPLRPYPRAKPDDADGDGRRDRDDPLLHDPRATSWDRTAK